MFVQKILPVNEAKLGSCSFENVGPIQKSSIHLFFPKASNEGVEG